MIMFISLMGERSHEHVVPLWYIC